MWWTSLCRKKKTAADSKDKATQPPDEDDVPDEDEIVEDWEMRFAKDVVSGVNAATRPKLVNGASKIVARVRDAEEKKLVAALNVIGVDWSAHPTKDEVRQEYAEIWRRLGARHQNFTCECVRPAGAGRPFFT